MSKTDLSPEEVFNGEVLWCSSHRLSHETTTEPSFKVPLLQFQAFEQLIGYLDDIFSSSGRFFLVVLDASRNVTECFKQYEMLHGRFKNIDVCMFYAKTFEPTQVWRFIFENIKPLLKKPKNISAPATNQDFDLSTQTNADE